MYYTVSQKIVPTLIVPTLASCSWDNHALILIIFSQQHRHTFKNDMRVQLFSFLHFHLLYLLLSSCDGNDAKQRVFLSRCWWLGKQPVSVRCSKRCHFAFMLAHNRFLHWPTSLLMTFFDMPAHVSMRRCFKSLVTAASVADRCLYNVHTFLHQSTHSVGLFGRHRSGEIKSGVSC